MAVPYIAWQGRRYSPAMRDCVQEWQRLAAAASIPFAVTQGGFNRGGVTASAGTHDGDAVDVSVRGLTQGQVASLVEMGRRVGLAAWFRTTKTAKWGTRAQGFGSYHIHAVPNGWGLPSTGARSQATAYRTGKDGLKLNLADLGPGHTSAYRARTWQGYLSLARPTTTGGLTMADAASLEKQIAELKALLTNPKTTTGVPYVSAQARAIAGLIVAGDAKLQSAIDALDIGGEVRAAVKALNVSGVDGDKLAESVVSRIAKRLEA